MDRTDNQLAIATQVMKAYAPAMRELARGHEVAIERHYTPDEVAAAWRLDVKSVRKLFRGEPGVLCIGRRTSTYGRRSYTTLRIPQSVLERVRRRMTA